jgi:tetratricopeptide (TPR) repeat protein
MKRVVMMLLAASLSSSAAAFAMTDAFTDLPRMDNPDIAKSAELKGDLARAHEDYAGAVAYYQKALRVDRQSPLLYDKLGVALLKLGHWGQARKSFSQALKYDAHNTSALNNLGAVACLERKYKSAVRYLKQALALDETSAPAHLNMAEAWMGLGEVDRSMTEYARAIELDADILSEGQSGIVARVSTPEQRARVSYLIARAYAKRGNMDGALEYLKRAKDGHFADLGRVYKDQEFAMLWQDPRLLKIIKP